MGVENVLCFDPAEVDEHAPYDYFPNVYRYKYIHAFMAQFFKNLVSERDFRVIDCFKMTKDFF